MVTYYFEKQLTKRLTWNYTQCLMPTCPDIAILKEGLFEKHVQNCDHKIPLIWPGNLVFDLKWPSFELDLEYIEANILSKFH